MAFARGDSITSALLKRAINLDSQISHSAATGGKLANHAETPTFQSLIEHGSLVSRLQVGITARLNAFRLSRHLQSASLLLAMLSCDSARCWPLPCAGLSGENSPVFDGTQGSAPADPRDLTRRVGGLLGRCHAHHSAGRTRPRRPWWCRSPGAGAPRSDRCSTTPPSTPPQARIFRFQGCLAVAWRGPGSRRPRSPRRRRSRPETRTRK